MIQKKTIANLSDLPEELISVIKTALSANRALVQFNLMKY